MRSLAVIAVACLLAGGCVTVYEDAPLIESELETPAYAVAQTIPLGTAPFSENDRMLMQLYDGVIRRLQEAADDRDVTVMFGLLDAYEKPGLPDWLGDRLRGYRSLAHGVAFVEHATSRSTLQLVEPQSGDGAPDAATAGAPASIPAPVVPDRLAPAAAVPAIGAPLTFEFRLPAPASPVRLGGRSDRDPIGFAIAIMIEDDYVNGDTKTHRRPEVHWLPEAVELGGDAVFRRLVVVDKPADGAVRRTVHLRIDLIGGYVQDGAHRAPVHRRTLAAASVTQWPAGHEPILERPLATLREALRLGDPQHFAHVYLGALFTTGAEREQALALLVDQVRFGPEALAVVAMAALHELTGVDRTIGDREAWLEWWNLRR